MKINPYILPGLPKYKHRNIHMLILDPQMLLTRICKYFRIDPSDCMGVRTHNQKVVMARHLTYYYCREYLNKTEAELKNIFGQSLSSVRYGIKNISDQKKMAVHHNNKKSTKYLTNLYTRFYRIERAILGRFVTNKDIRRKLST